MTSAEAAARQSIAKRLERVEEAIARTEALKEGSRTPSDSSSGSTPHVPDQTAQQNGNQDASHAADHGCPVCRSKSSAQLPSRRVTHTPLGQIYFAGQNFGAICCRNGVPHFTASGEQWIHSRTGQWPRFGDIYGSETAAPPGLPVAASTLYSLSNRSYQGHDAQLPSRWVVQSLLDEFIASDFSLVFPLVDRVLFEETAKLAYSRQKPLMCEYVGAKACVFAFVSMASSNFPDLEAASHIDPDACAKEAQILLADFLEDASITTLQTMFMLVREQSLTRCLARHSPVPPAPSRNTIRPPAGRHHVSRRGVPDDVFVGRPHDYHARIDWSRAHHPGAGGSSSETSVLALLLL